MRIKNSIKNIYTGVSSQVVSIIMRFLYRTVFIQILGVTYLGINGLFTNVLLVFSFAELGIGQAIVYSLYKPIANKNKKKICALMELYKKTYQTIGIIILLIGLSFMPFLSYIIKESTKNIDNINLIYILFVINSGVTYFYSYRITFIIVNQKSYMINKVNFVYSIISELIKISILIIFKNYIILLVISSTLTIIKNIYLSELSVRKFPYIKDTAGYKLKKQEKKKIFKNVRALIIYKVGTLSLNSTDNIIISTFVGLATVGLYSNYLVIVKSLTMLVSILFSSLTASIGNLNATENIHKRYFMFNVINLATFWIYSLLSIGIYICINPLIILWIGDKFILNSQTVLIITLNIYVGGMLFSSYNYRQTLGLFIYGKWRPIISAIINLAFSIFLGKRYGLNGILFATIIARMTTNVWYDPYIVHRKGFNKSPIKYYVKYLLYFGGLIFTGLITSFIASLVSINGLLGLMIDALIVVILVNSIFYLIFFKTREFCYLRDVVMSNFFKTNRRNL